MRERQEDAVHHTCCTPVRSPYPPPPRQRAKSIALARMKVMQLPPPRHCHRLKLLRRQEDTLHGMQQRHSAEDPEEAQEEEVLVVAEEAEVVVTGQGEPPLGQGQQDVGPHHGVEVEEPHVGEAKGSFATMPHQLE
jgi:hypothetical protein